MKVGEHFDAGRSVWDAVLRVRPAGVAALLAQPASAVSAQQGCTADPKRVSGAAVSTEHKLNLLNLGLKKKKPRHSSSEQFRIYSLTKIIVAGVLEK